MSSSPEVHKFNDDLLLNREDLKLATLRYPTIVHVLDHPELRKLFSEYDKPANQAKRSGRTLGICAIGFVFVALAIASVEHVVGHAQAVTPMIDRIRELPTLLALVSAACGVIGVLIGAVGILHARKKRDWLYRRLMTERTRQFHFQTFVMRLPNILDSLDDAAAKDVFTRERAAWFEIFKANFNGKLDSEFTKVLDDEECSNLWLHDPSGGVGVKESKKFAPLFAAYRELRIMHQIGYADHMLRRDHRLFSTAPRDQAEVLSTLGFLCVALLCAIHVGVILLVLFSPSTWSVVGAAASSIAILLALSGLAVRALEQGLQPEREVERYRQYRSALHAVRDRYDQAASQSEKIGYMREMERLSFDEMRNFLITNERSRFVM